jgi:hypothetical protein
VVVTFSATSTSPTSCRHLADKRRIVITGAGLVDAPRHASQVLELKKQIARAGHVLVKEYIDDGYSGTMLDRPALEELRRDARPRFSTRYISTPPIVSPQGRP